MSSTITAIASSRAPGVRDDTRIAMPTVPSPMPANTIGDGRWPPGRHQSSSTIQIAADATRIAVMPVGSRCCAHATLPLPKSISSAPTSAADFQCARVGGGFPRQRDHRYIAPPASMKRTPAMRYGGMLAMASFIPRNVAPQTRYTARNATMTLEREGAPTADGRLVGAASVVGGAVVLMAAGLRRRAEI